MSHEPIDAEILPPDPSWQPPRTGRAVVYEATPVAAGEAGEAGAATVGVRTVHRPADPGLIGRLLSLGFRLAVLGLVALFAVWLFEPFGPDPLVQITAWLRGAGPAGKVLVVLLTAALCPVLVPVGPLALLPGYLWGATEGTALALAGAGLGGLLNYALSRRFLQPHVRAWAASNPLLGSLANTIDRRGFRIVLGLRMSPLMPFGLLAYLSGVTRLSPLRFLLAIVIGGVPWTTVYGMAGAMLAESAREVTLEGIGDRPEAVAMRWIGLAVTVGLAVWVGRVARKDLLQARAGGRA